MKILRNIPLVCFALTLIISSHSRILAKSLEEEYNLQRNQPSISQQKILQPQHLLLNALDLQKKGYLARALAKLSEAYGEEKILVSGYYNLLDRKRRIILKEIENGAPWFPGDSGSQKALQSIKSLFENLQLPQENANSSMPYETTILPRERFINYRIVQTVLHKDAQDSLNSPDPWMVSTVLFLARRGEVTVSPQDVIRRWEDRPDLWDDVTEEQALLYLATLPAGVIRTLSIHNDDVRDAIQSRFKEKDNPLLLKCSFHIDRDSRMIFIDMSIIETVPYESLKRVEISLRNKNEKEFFRAMNNRMEHPAPIPPNAFGVYPVGSKKVLTDSDILDAGHEASTLVKTKYGNLVDGCKTSWNKGVLHINWKIHLLNRIFPDERRYIFVKIIPHSKNSADWEACGNFTYPVRKITSDSFINSPSKLGTVTPQFYNRYNHKKIKEGTFSYITLVTLKRVPAKAVIIQKRGDTPSKFVYIEVSRKSVDLKKHKAINLEPGFYRFEYNDVSGNPPAGFYGKSGIFEVKYGNNMEISIWVVAAI